MALDLYKYYKGESSNPYKEGTVEYAFWHCERMFANKLEHGAINTLNPKADFASYAINMVNEYIPSKFGISRAICGKAYFSDIANLPKYYHWENENPYKSGTPDSYFWEYEQEFLYRWLAGMYKDDAKEAFAEFKQWLLSDLLPEKWGGTPEWYKTEYGKGAK